ncbi:hypothetical protein ES707_08448 [subsurface metagenome]
MPRSKEYITAFQLPLTIRGNHQCTKTLKLYGRWLAEIKGMSRTNLIKELRSLNKKRCWPEVRDKTIEKIADTLTK